MIDIYVTHFLAEELSGGYNDMLIDQLIWMRAHTAGDYRMTVVYFSTSARHEEDLQRRIPPFVRLVRNDRLGRPDLQPSMRNKVTSLAKESRCEYFVLLHNDIRVSRNWLPCLIGDLRDAEQQYGPSSVIISPRYIPYHWAEPDSIARSHEKFWEALKNNVSVLSPGRMADWCYQCGFTMDENVVVSRPSGTATDDGHQLMMFATAPSFFDAVGECDERFVGANYDDCDWGIRALQAGKWNLQSQSALVGHIQGMTFFNPALPRNERVSAEVNAQAFITKWGRGVFDEMQSGALWRRLHEEQRRKC